MGDFGKIPFEHFEEMVEMRYRRPELRQLREAYSFSKMLPSIYDMHRILLNTAWNIGPKHYLKQLLSE